jgi:hypothetical protein
MAPETKTNPAKFEVLAAVKSVGGTSTKPTIQAVASSDSVDLGSDRFTVSALQQMAVQFPTMTAFRNHSYSVPEDVVGVVSSAKVVARDGHNDLDIVIAVETSNPAAMAVLEQCRNGVRLGVSVGVLVNSARTTTEEIDGRKVKVLNIDSVTCLELSVVGLPLNRRSWVHGAMKAASWAARHDLAGDDDEPMDGEELTMAKALLRLCLAGLAAKDAELDEARELVGELAKGLNWFMDLPMPRKTDPSVAASLNTLADRFPHLDERILASVARAQQ